MRFIKLKEVMDCTELGPSTIYKYIDNKKFPKQIPLGDTSLNGLNVKYMIGCM